MGPSPRPWAAREDSSSSLSDVENRPPTSTVRPGRVPPIQTGMLSASYAFSHANSPRSHRKKFADEAKKPRRRRVQWKDEDEFEQLSPASSVGSPVSAKCPRILRAKSLRGANYSPTAKRWIALLILIAGLGLLRSFVVTRQVLHSAIADRYHQRGGTDWLASLPQTIYATLSGGESVVEDIDWTPIALDEERKRAGTMTQCRAQRRRMRTKPPSAYPSNPFGSVKAKQKLQTPPPRLMLDLPSHRELKAEASPSSQSKHNNIRRRLEEGDEQEQPEQEQPLFCGQQADEASQLVPQNFPPSAAIGPGSRVVVTGALSQIAMEVILQLHEQCGAKVIIGIDSAYPNTRHERMDMVESRYEYLRRRVPGMQNLIVPTFGIYPDPNQNNMGGFDLVQRLKPTHIVHLAGMEEGRGEYTDFGETISPFDGNRSLMRMLESILSMDQVLSSIAASNKDRLEGQQPPQLVYISSNEAGDRPGVMLDGGSVTAASVYGTTSLLKEMLASYYHRHHGVSSVGIRVPTVFGPFSRPGSLLYDMAERTVRNAAGKDVDNVPSYHLDRDRYELSNILSRREGALSEAKEQLVYGYDVASAILSALQFKKDYGSAVADSTGAAIVIRIGSKYTTSMKDLNERMKGYLPLADQWEPNANSSLAAAENSHSAAVINSPGLSISDTERDRDLLGWTHTTGIHEGTKAALAWQVLKAYPYGLPETVPGYSSFHSLLKDSRDSLPYHSLPCASGCRWGGRMCSPSVWDEVMETTKKITESCQYVLYTVDLHPMLKGMMKQSEPSERPGWEEQFCKIAFISSDSKLARITYAELEKGVPLQEWNGSRKQGYWTIVVVPGSKETLPEDQTSMAKLSPTNLFSDEVERAMFMNHRRIVVTTDQAMNVMAQMEVEEMPEPEPYTVYDSRLKHNVVKFHPSHPGRRSVFFTTRFSFPKGWNNDAGKLAQVVGASAKVPRTAGTQRQTDFYKETSSLVRTCHQRSPEYQRYFQDNHFNFDFVRTSWVVHDLTSEAGRTLRCEMYEEHSLWGNNGMEDMSIAYVLAKRKVKRQLGPTALEMDEMEQWHPLLVPRGPDDEAIREGPVYFDYLESAQREMTDSEGETMHVSFFPQQAK